MKSAKWVSRISVTHHSSCNSRAHFRSSPQRVIVYWKHNYNSQQSATTSGYKSQCHSIRSTSDTTHRMVRSRSPTFPMFIDNECFIRVQTYMASIDYKGPVALGCDDSKLHPSLQVCWDSSVSGHILIGTTVQQKIIVANPEELRIILTQYKDDVATKVCATSLSVSLC